VLVVLAACRVGDVEPRPLSGTAPEVVAVWPFVEDAGTMLAGAEPTVVFAGLDEGLRRRGYGVVSPEVAAQVLREAGWAVSTADWSAAGRILQADAVLQFVVREFDVSVDRALTSARWDLEWRLESTRGLGRQWTFAHHGTWRARDRESDDPMRAHDEPPDIVPIGGSRSPGFRDSADLLAWLHRFALDHLPVRTVLGTVHPRAGSAVDGFLGQKPRGSFHSSSSTWHAFRDETNPGIGSTSSTGP
jgi:hypothetical protein